MTAFLACSLRKFDLPQGPVLVPVYPLRVAPIDRHYLLHPRHNAMLLSPCLCDIEIDRGDEVLVQLARGEVAAPWVLRRSYC